MALPQCASGIGTALGQTNVAQGHVEDRFLLVQGPAGSPPTLRGGVEIRDVVNTLTNFNMQVILASGPGPTYIDELVLAQLQGVMTGPIQNVRSIAASTILPSAGRPFDRTIDAIHVKGTAAFTGATTMVSGWGFDFCYTNEAVDACCDQLNAKLDQILELIAKPFYSQP